MGHMDDYAARDPPRSDVGPAEVRSVPPAGSAFSADPSHVTAASNVHSMQQILRLLAVSDHSLCSVSRKLKRYMDKLLI